jgi:surface antigen
MKRVELRRCLAGVGFLAMLAGCGTVTADGQPTGKVGGFGMKESAGTLGGAALGGLAGAQLGRGTGSLAATGAGVLLGGLLGNQVGKSLDRADTLAAQRTPAQALETAPTTGQARPWRNPDTGNAGTVMPPTRTYEPARPQSEGQVCREYRQAITVGGRAEQGFGRACRQPDGSWKIVS